MECRHDRMGDSMHPKLDSLLRFWTGLCAARAWPARRDFQPEDLRPWLGHIALLDVQPGPRFHVRLTGVVIAEFDGGDYTGRYLEDAVPPEIRAMVMAPYLAVLAEGRPVHCHTPAGYADGSFRSLQRLLLPLSGDGQRIDMIMLGLYPLLTDEPGPDSPTFRAL